MADGRARSTRTGSLGWAGAALVLAVVLSALAAGPAGARVVFIHGKAYGVMPSAGARELAAPAGRATPLTTGGPQPAPTYHGGPLMLSSTLYLIFWDPQEKFAPAYTEPIVQYAKDLQADDALSTDEFSIAKLYADGEGKHITGNVGFGDAIFDRTAYPAAAGECSTAPAPCVTDEQIEAEIVKQIEKNGWPTDPAATPRAQYLLYTPPGVGICDGEGSCSFSAEGFCAYHSEITKIGPEHHVVNYSVLPEEPECNSEQHPAGVGGEANADGTLDSEIHELVESATDPAGTGYLNTEGNEVADMCTYPLVETQPDIYGTPLGGNLSEDTAFNQLIQGHAYYTQQIWSDEPTQTPASTEPAGCVARIGPTPSFVIAGPELVTGQAVKFDGSGSYDVQAPIGRYEWSFGDGSPADTTSGANAEHVYDKPGTYQVSLTVTDADGAADASTQTVPVTIGGTAIGGGGEHTEEPGAGSKETGGGSGSGTGNPGSGTSNTGAGGGASGTSTTPATTGAGSSPSTSTKPSRARPAALSRTQKLARALAACHKLPRRRRARCVATAKRRFAPPRSGHTKAKPRVVRQPTAARQPRTAR